MVYVFSDDQQQVYVCRPPLTKRQVTKEGMRKRDSGSDIHRRWSEISQLRLTQSMGREQAFCFACLTLGMAFADICSVLIGPGLQAMRDPEHRS
jgi:hypothetical protein